jgi:Domain of unknown function (DUF6268)
MQPYRVLILLSLILLHAPASASGQTSLSIPGSSEAAPFRTYGLTSPLTEAISKPDAERQVTGVSAPMIPDPDTYLAPPGTASGQPWRLITDTRFDATVLPSQGNNGLVINDLEFASTLNYNLGLVPLKITPYAAVHLWSAGTAAPFLYLYDLNVEFAWRPRLAQWLFLDLAVTPGLYTDCKNVTAESFQMRGRGLAIVAFSPQLQLAGGAMYVNRNRSKVLPAGGVIWQPSDDTRYFLVFPQPKVSHRFVAIKDTQLWIYVAGEFGGGRWEVERAPGLNDSLDYTDLRVVLGIEAVQAERVRGHIELGYVFNRRVNFAGASSDFQPQSTMMLRAGLRF